MLLDLFKKHDRHASLRPSNQDLLVPAGQKLLNAALDAGIDWPHDCRVGSCGKCKCTLKEGKIKALSDFSYTLEGDEIERGMILACQSQLKTDVIVEINIGEGGTQREHVDGTIKRIQTLTHDIVELEVEFECSAFASMQAGQYLEVSNSHIAQPRSYSLARCPQPQGISSAIFTIRHVPGGEFTDWLFAADRSGERLQLSGPYGDFYLRSQQSHSRLLCVAGGSGLAPIIAIIEQGIKDKRNEECIVLFGARTQQDLYYLDLLQSLAEQWAGKFEIVLALSNEPSDSDWQGARGLVTDFLQPIAKVNDFSNDQAYLCGPPVMIDAAIAELLNLKMKEENIFFDKFLDASSMPAGR